MNFQNKHQTGSFWLQGSGNKNGDFSSLDYNQQELLKNATSFFTDIECPSCSSFPGFPNNIRNSTNPQFTNPYPVQDNSKVSFFESPVGIRGNPGCSLSRTEINSVKMCRREEFSGLRYTSHASLGVDEASFTVFTANGIVPNDGRDMLSCTPTTLENTKGPNAVDRDIQIINCTSTNNEWCFYHPSAYLISPPVVGCRITTEGNHNFLYGFLKVRAKLPQGDWIVSEISLKPERTAYGSNGGKIIIARSRGNRVLTDDKNQDYSNRILEAGIVLENNSLPLFSKVLWRPWSDDYHDFAIMWTPDMFQFFADNEEIGRIDPREKWLGPFLRGSRLALLNQRLHLMFTVYAGGNRDFPNNLVGKPWKNYEPKDKLKFWQARDKWLPTWRGKSTLRISKVTVTAID